MTPLMKQFEQEYLQKDSVYKPQLDKFISFLALPEINLLNAPAKINKLILDNFISYCVQNATINYINTLKGYLEAIKSFYRFLLQQGYVENQLVPVDMYSTYISEQAQKHHLKNPTNRQWMDDATIKCILEYLDSYFADTKYSNLSGSHECKRYVDRITLRIYVKICLIAPAKKNRIFNLKFSSFSEDFRKMSINGIELPVPYGLRSNLLDMLQLYRQKPLNLTPAPDEGIFSFINKAIDSKNTPERLNYCLAYFLREYNIISLSSDCSSYPVENIANTTIYHMIIDGTSPFFISQLTGISISSLETKYYAPLSNQDFLNYLSIDETLNRTISNCSYYQYL